MNARLLDADWRSACGALPGGERPLWLDDDDDGMPRHEPRGNDGLSASGVCVRVGASTLLRGVDLHLAPGEVGAILGPNGAGKSTLLSVLAGLRACHEGEVRLNGQAVTPAAAPQFARHRAVLPQETAVAFDFRVQDVVELGRYPHLRQPSRHEAAIVQAAMQATGVAAMAMRNVASLSGGERARVQLARVMAQIWEAGADGAPRWLLLDEPTAALDLRHQHETLRTVQAWARGQGVGVLAVLHDPNLALRYADRVWVLDGGEVRAAGRPARVLHPDLLRRVWQVQASTVRAADGVAQLLIAADVPPVSERS
ncbi:heme ABC transporter ATP-binding protein [Hydrogenophaga sp.]|uniref:heme ABC transporter ATP-binding protein n=1 Tax=Hydrogenophaga sp. TaxID=1904254 RepID=UPI002607146A|nr:heme ABC transporter ATP-binding protein [Hydrogenophaga sp.]